MSTSFDHNQLRVRGVLEQLDLLLGVGYRVHDILGTLQLSWRQHFIVKLARMTLGVAVAMTPNHKVPREWGPTAP